MSHSINCLLILAFLLQAHSLHLGKHAHLKYEERILDESDCITCPSDNKGKHEAPESLDDRMRVQGSNEADKFKQSTRTKRGSIYRDEDAEHDSAEETEDEKEEKEGETDSEDLNNKPADKAENSTEDGKTSQAVDDNETEKDHSAEESDGPEEEKKEEEEKDVEKKDEETEGKGGEDTDKSVENTTKGNEHEEKIHKNSDESVENDKKIGDKDKDKESNIETSSTPELEVQLQLDMILTPADIWSLILGASDIISNAGDYLISLVLRNLKHNLHHTRIDKRFKAALEKLTKSKDVDSKKALNLLTAKIRQQFGRSYEIQLVKFLKDLQDSTKF